MSAPYPTRASSRPAWDTGSTSHRRFRAGLHEGPKSFVVPEPALPNRTHPEPQRHVDAEVAMEALEGREFLREVHLATDDRAAARTFALLEGRVTFGHPSPDSFRGESVY